MPLGASTLVGAVACCNARRTPEMQQTPRFLSVCDAIELPARLLKPDRKVFTMVTETQILHHVRADIFTSFC